MSCSILHACQYRWNVELTSLWITYEGTTRYYARSSREKITPNDIFKDRAFTTWLRSNDSDLRKVYWVVYAHCGESVLKFVDFWIGVSKTYFTARSFGARVYIPVLMSCVSIFKKTPKERKQKGKEQVTQPKRGTLKKIGAPRLHKIEFQKCHKSFTELT